MDTQDKFRKIEIEITNEAKDINHSHLASYEKIVCDEAKSKEERLKAYSILFTFYRRRKDLHKCYKLYSDYKNEFSDDFLFNHLYSIALKETGREKDLLESINISKKCLTIHPGSAGAIHNLASSLFKLSKSPALSDKERNKILQEGLELTEEAIEREPEYAKFYSTRAKFNSKLGFFKSAEKDIITAINKEDSSGSDYSIIISDYLSIKMEISIEKTSNKINQDTEQKIRRISEDAKKNNLQILSFFIAAISFVIGSVTLAKGSTATEAMQLILVLASALLLTMIGYSYFISVTFTLTRFVVPLVISTVLFFASTCLPYIKELIRAWFI